MSHIAIAAALALKNVSAGERLTAFSLASFANREHRAWPGTRVAAVRAGLSRSQYLAARDGLQRRGLVAIEAVGGGRGHSPVVALHFAQVGPWCDGEINAALFEAVLGYSRSTGSARLLLAALAAVADDEGVVGGVATDEIRVAAGMADSTYRRARAALLTSGELVLDTPGGGRARTNRWRLRSPGADGAKPAVAARPRVTPSRAARPLIGTVKESAPISVVEEVSTRSGRAVKGPRFSGESVANPAQDRTVWAGKGPGLSGVSERIPAQKRTVSPKTQPQTPPETPSQTPPRNARAGREPRNPRTQKDPPTPLRHEGSSGAMSIEECYVTDRGRTRRRKVRVDLDEVRRGLGLPTSDDRGDWMRIRELLGETVGESTFAIWLAPLELVAVDRAGTLVIGAAPETASWIRDRFGRLLTACAQRLGHELRIATEPERTALQRDSRGPTSDAVGCEIDEREVS